MFNNQGAPPEPETEPGQTLPLEDAITLALTRKPVVSVPDHFAARIARRAVDAADKPPARSTWIDLAPHLWAGLGRFGNRDITPRVAAVSGALLLGALFAFAPHTRPSFLDLRFDLQLTFLVELGGVGYLLSRTGLAR